MILISHSYDALSEVRAAELAGVRRANEESGLFREIVYLQGDDWRVQFRELFQLAGEYRGETCVIANADIEFNETIKVAGECARDERVIALTRWDGEMSPVFCGHSINSIFFSGTQDTWVIKGGGIDSDVGSDICMGTVACDNVLAGRFVSAGYEVFNPCLAVRTMHRHADAGRPVTPGNAGVYGYPAVATLNTLGGVALQDVSIGPTGEVNIGNFWIEITCRR